MARPDYTAGVVMTVSLDELLTRLEAVKRAGNGYVARCPMQRHCNTPPEGPLKRCTCCGEEQPATTEYFPQDRHVKSGLSSWCRECRRKRQLSYGAAHRAEANAYFARYREQNRERLAENERLRQAAQGDRCRELHRASYARHREENRERDRLRRLEPGRADAVRVAGQRRRARQLGASGHHTAADVAAQRTRQKGLCFWCREKVGRSYHVDHVVPLSRGGSDGPENLVIACASCNLHKSARHPMDFAGVMF